VHGSDTAPIEMVNALLGELLRGELPLACHLMILFGNPLAMRQGERYLDYDMNRLFNRAHLEHPGMRESHRAAALERLAGRLFETAPAAARRLHFDLHCAIRGSVYQKFAIYPYLQQRQPKSEQLAWLQACDIDTVLLHSKPASSFCDYTSQAYGCDALTLELGRARPFGSNHAQDLSGIEQGLRRLISGQPTPPAPSGAAMRLFSAKYELIKHSEAFVLHLDDTVENFSPLPDGYLIAEEGARRYVAQGGEERILFPNPSVNKGLRAGIVVEPASF
jgi:succinylglutamate desuccinylase